MRVWFALAAATVAGCGHAAQPTATAGGTAAAPPGTAAPVSCADAGVILRGRVEDQRMAGPAKEAAIASACDRGRWSARVLECVGTQPRARHCLEALSGDQRIVYARKLAAWSEQFPDELLDEPYEERFDGGEPDDIECGDAVHDVEQLAPPVTATGDDRELAVSLRERAVVAQCDDGWSNDARACFRDAAPGGDAACRLQLEPDQQKGLADELASLDQLIARIEHTRKQPSASFDCRRTAAAHYADAAWQGKLESVKGAARTKAIADSRARMARVCIDGKWSATQRACIVAGGADRCFGALALGVWGFPAAGVAIKTGIAECDGYSAAVAAAARCDKLPQPSRDALLLQLTATNQSLVSLPPDATRSAAARCRQADELVRQLAGSVGCKL